MSESSKKRLLYVFTSAPYSNATGQEGVDAVLMGAAFEQEISVLFLHDGVFQLKGGQNNTDSSIKQYTKTFAALTDFDVTAVYANEQSLLARGLTTEDCSIELEMLSNAETAALMRQQDRVFTF
ncbi:MAG: sulfurtransferase complex subunit TusC [Pseudomonadota bacterium]